MGCTLENRDPRLLCIRRFGSAWVQSAQECSEDVNGVFSLVPLLLESDSSVCHVMGNFVKKGVSLS